LILDAGVVEINVHDGSRECYRPPATYFIDERVSDLVLEQWLKTYTGPGGCFLDHRGYSQLVEDYNLPFAMSLDALHRLDKDGDGGVGLSDFKALLEDARVLEIGTSVWRDDETGRAWRRLEETLTFLPPTRVFVADGREGTSPPKDANSVRFVCISDTHGRHWEMTQRLPAGDVLLHAGDFSMSGEEAEVLDFSSWLRSLHFSKKVIIAGNHDLTFEQKSLQDSSKGKPAEDAVRQAFLATFKEDDNVVYLEDAECSVQGIRIYGTPWQPEFGYWAFNLPRGAPIAEKWTAIPAGIDVLLVHGPPLGRGDACLPARRRVGCADLLTEIQSRIRPGFCVYGHVHEGAGVTFDGTTHFINASSLNENYECVYAPIVFDVLIPSDAKS